MKNATLMIEGFQFDEAGKLLPAQPGQRHWDGLRWITIAKVELTVEMFDDHVELVSATLEGESITERDLMNVLRFRGQSANGAMLQRAYNDIYFDNKAVAYC